MPVFLALLLFVSREHCCLGVSNSMVRLSHSHQLKHRAHLHSPRGVYKVRVPSTSHQLAPVPSAETMNAKDDRTINFHRGSIPQFVQQAVNTDVVVSDPVAADVRRLHAQANPVTSAEALLDRIRQTAPQSMRRHSTDAVPAPHAFRVARSAATAASCTTDSSPEALHLPIPIPVTAAPQRPCRAQTTAPFHLYASQGHRVDSSPSAAAAAGGGTVHSPDDRPMQRVQNEAVMRWLRQSDQQPCPMQSCAGCNEALETRSSSSVDMLDETHHNGTHHASCTQSRCTRPCAPSPFTSGKLSA